MTAKTGAEREAARKARKAASGLKRVEEYVPPEHEEALRRFAAELRQKDED